MKRVTSQELSFARALVRWIETARKTGFGAPNWLPKETDVVKSTLLQRLYSGYEPLDEPPPLANSCPWYGIVEDPGPHSVANIWRDAVQSDVLWAYEYPYRIVKQLGEEAFVVCDARKETTYRFRLWRDNNIGSQDGTRVWLIQNVAFGRTESGAHFKAGLEEASNTDQRQVQGEPHDVQIKTALFALGRALLDVRGMAIELRRNIRLSEDAAGQFETDLAQSLGTMDEFFRILGDAQTPRSIQSNIQGLIARGQAGDSQEPNEKKMVRRKPERVSRQRRTSRKNSKRRRKKGTGFSS